MLGTASNSSSSTGSIHAKLRSLIADTVGFTTDALSTTGTLMARLRALSEGLGITLAFVISMYFFNINAQSSS
ncbi:hypothetical protein LC605_31415 [Nostoc sp. CHAB 5836]|uniref:hypothetical protein n=1 Tax=Nostoc sp. CHAB 5836 TaxID=2780404 RepID=UPI001E3C158E|nr:hypothetical protein [Nostoc sp. CHAB 5836]MCC5619482.1 hypothetical protein [Nostoc sp. CHAB 5836]